jgi:hypothetical protein
VYEERLANGDRRFHRTAIPAVGAFHDGDVLVTSLNAHFESRVCRDIIHVERPTRYLVLRVTMAEPPAYLPPARLTAYRVGDGLGDLSEAGQAVTIEPTVAPDGTVRLEHVVAFPESNSFYVLEWETEF